MNNKNVLIALVTVVMGLQSILRLFFVGVIFFGEINQFLEVELSQATLQMIAIVFTCLGISGMTLTYGLWKTTEWGYWGTILHGAVTVLFDIWGLTIQYTAAMGFIFPAILVLLIVPKRQLFLEPK
ncbi:MAG: DUF2127 domain-containing protein [Candidatus Odinarchaeota archaeon]